MSKKNLTKNYIYNLSYQILLFLTPLITTPYISRVLGPDGIGTSSYTNSVVTYFTMFAVLGTTDYGQREIAYRQDDMVDRSRMFWELLILRAFTSSISLILFLMLTAFSNNRAIFWIQAINIISVACDVTWFFQGIEEFGKIVLRNTAVRLISAVSIFIFVKTHDDLPAYIICIAMTILIGHMSVWMYIPRYVCKIKLRELSPFLNIKGVIQLFIPQVAIQVSAVLDKTMLGLILNSSIENGCYEQANHLKQISMTVITALGAVMVPRVSYIYAQGDKTKLKQYLYQAYRFIWLIALPMFLGLFAIADQFIPWFLGPSFEKSIVLVRILSIVFCIVGISNVTGVQYFVPTGKQRQFTLSVLLGMGANIVFNLFLIPRYLSVGAAIATVISEAIVTVSQLKMAQDVFSVKKIIRSSKNYIISAVGMSFVLYTTKLYVEKNWMGTLVLLVLGVVSYLLFLVLLKDSMITDFFKKKNDIKST